MAEEAQANAGSKPPRPRWPTQRSISASRRSGAHCRAREPRARHGRQPRAGRRHDPDDDGVARSRLRVLRRRRAGLPALRRAAARANAARSQQSGARRPGQRGRLSARGHLDFVETRSIRAPARSARAPSWPIPTASSRPACSRACSSRARAFSALLIDEKAVLTDQDREYVYVSAARTRRSAGTSSSAARWTASASSSRAGRRARHRGRHAEGLLARHARAQTVAHGAPAAASRRRARRRSRPTQRPPSQRSSHELRSVLRRPADLRGGAVDRHLRSPARSRSRCCRSAISGRRAADRPGRARSSRAPIPRRSPTPSRRRSRKRSSASRT